MDCKFFFGNRPTLKRMNLEIRAECHFKKKKNKKNRKFYMCIEYETGEN